MARAGARKDTLDAFMHRYRSDKDKMPAWVGIQIYKSGFTYEFVALAANISRATLYNYINARHKTSAGVRDKLHKISYFLQFALEGGQLPDPDMHSLADMAVTFKRIVGIYKLRVENTTRPR